MIQADMHMPTWFSTDSEACPCDMADEAVRKGLKTICFTDHFDKDDLEWGEEGIFDVDAYFVEMQKLQEEYAGKLNIRIGIELGLRTYLKDYYEEKLFTDRTDKEAYRLMMETTLENVRTSDCFQTLGHLDYVVRYGKSREKEYSYTDYADIIDEILKLLIEKEKGLEVNSAGLKYGLPFAHPHPDVLKRYRELGGEIITIGADAHKPEHIAYDFAKAEEILKSCGFKYYTEFFEQKPVFKQLI